MRIFIFSILIFSVVSCKETEQPKAKTGQTPMQMTSVPDETVQVNHVDADTTKILMMGRGSEPGWICQFYQTKVRFVYNNGTDSMILRGFDFSNQMRMEKGFENFKLESPGKDTSFVTLPGPCKEESTGEERSMKMEIKLKKRTFKGCAWVPN
jgi:uncharacterized membrane protein